MKKLLLALLVLSACTAGKAQYSKVLIQLTDKAGSSYSLTNPSQFLSNRAIQRRTKYNIPIDSTDIPVSKRYIDSLRLAGSVTVLSASKWLNQVLIQTTDANALNKIRSFPFVKRVAAVAPRPAGTAPIDKFKESIQPFTDQGNRANTTQSDHYDYGQNYNQVHIHQGEYLHNKGYRGNKIQITVLDAGFNQYESITAFDSLRMNNRVLGVRDFVAFDNSVNEDDSHGMFCLSTMSANWPGRMVGTAPEAKYWLIRTEDVTSEYPIEEHNWVVGAEFADSTGSDLISSSLGYYDFDDPSMSHTYNDLYKNTTTVSKGATLAFKKGMIVMNSAGNEGNSGWRYVIFPADADSVCAVGAVNNAGLIAGFSSRGYPGKVKPNIVSVGAGTVIAGFNNQPVTGNGTSFSNPNVAGLVACLWDAFPDVRNSKILEAVYRSADKYNNPDSAYGYGIPNFRNAYAYLKHEQNVAIYDTFWLFASPNPFGGQIEAKFLGRIDGDATLYLMTKSGQVISKQDFVTEREELYNFSFKDLDYLPGDDYILRYKDSTRTRDLILTKNATANPDWLKVYPNPYSTNFFVYYKASDSGTVLFRLLDSKGSIIETVKVLSSKAEAKTFQFKSAARLPKGVYYVEYRGKTNRVLKVVKS